ncbi:MAG: glycoside hydrolase family 2 protein, partial [Planctomycetota bacterium]
MQQVTLTGDWTVRSTGRGATVDPLPARVPGCVHHDLERAGRIPDPYVGEHELLLQWIGETDWLYERDFTVGTELLAADAVQLCCDGLDTIAEVHINGELVGRTDNMFRPWRWNVQELLRAGSNHIAIRFAAAVPHVQAYEDERRHLQTTRCVPHEPAGRPWIRKEQCNFGWDWGPVLVTCGIWADIRLEPVQAARIDTVHLRQEHGGGSVLLDCSIELERIVRGALQARIRVQLGGETVAEEQVPLRGKRAAAELQVSDPQLWWPNGLGAQPLYTVTVDLLDDAGTGLDQWRRRIGLRTIELVRERDGARRQDPDESFAFRCNGVDFFAKGANWIPADAIIGRLEDERYNRLLSAARDAHMNMIRVWGGGIYERTAFYDRCDELGLLVWQDFMFACSAYPADDSAFMANVEAEAVAQIRRLRHHACLALWCGNNELEMHIAKRRKERDWPHMPWRWYRELFDKLLPRLVRRHDPDTAYWPCSPHTPRGDRDQHNDERCGDTHFWAVWHGRQPFEWYRGTQPRFCSEFGFQAFPEPATVATYATTADETNITSPVMEHHQRSAIGNSTIVHYLCSWFPMPRGSEELLWLSQIQQGLAIQYAVEHWRRHMHRCRGALYWQLNDCWPVASWASIDYLGRWKALQYLAKRFFA